LAAKLKNDRDFPAVLKVRATDFKRLLQQCETPEKASASLKAFFADGKKLVKK
jgi:hypothetical protein